MPVDPSILKLNAKETSPLDRLGSCNFAEQARPE
jgi:hypothetical protein